MMRVILGVIAGFFAWIIVWLAVERVLSAISPDWFGAQQAAFQAVLENGGQFHPDAGFLLTHIVCAAIIAGLSGFLAAAIAGENKRAPLILTFLLLALGLVKLVFSWAFVPAWYNLIFTAILIPMTIIGGKLKKAA